MKGYRARPSTLRELDNTSFVLSATAIVILIIISVVIIVPKTNKQEPILSQSEQESNEQIDRDTQEVPTKTYSNAEDDIVNDIKAPSDVSSYYKVIRVVDGDTIDVGVNGQSVRVRMIGVNTPETVHPEKPVECFGKEASNYTNKSLYGKYIQLELDASQDTYDSYSRLLAYVYIDGNNFNYRLIRDGYAYEYTYNVPYKYQKEFKAAQRYADTNNIGLWNPNVCAN